MKYIRTKDGLYVAYVNDNASLEEINNAYKEDKAIAIADTIKELCDEFVLVRNKDNAHFTAKLDTVSYWAYMMKHISKTEIYGAIWTDKGLIYAAKMNEKGELELI